MAGVEEGATPLMYACQQSREKHVLDLLAKKASAAYETDRTRKTALHYCAENLHTHCAEALLRVAPDIINLRDEDGYSPLHLAVIAGNKPLIQLLLSRGADVNALDQEKHSVVHWATVCGEQEALEMVLRAGANVSTADMHGGYPLHYAAQMCGPGADVRGDTRAGLAVLRTLLSFGADVDDRDKDGRQPILWAASADSQSRDPGARFASSGSAEAILALVKAGARVGAADKDGLTALHCAASRGHTDCLETLVGLCGEDVDTIDINGCTALFYSVTLGHADATQLLLSLGAEPNRQDRKGRTPAHCGAAKGQLETLRLLVSRGANLWLRNVKGDLPLHEAVASGRRELVQWLLNQRPHAVNIANNDGKCPIHVASINNNVDMLKILLDSGSLVNPVLRSNKGVMMTPLDAALHRGHRSCAKFLQLHGGVPRNKLTDASASLRGTVSRDGFTTDRFPENDAFTRLPLSTDSALPYYEDREIHVSAIRHIERIEPASNFDQKDRRHNGDSSEEDQKCRRRRRRRKNERRRNESFGEEESNEDEAEQAMTRPHRKSSRRRSRDEGKKSKNGGESDSEHSSDETVIKNTKSFQGTGLTRVGGSEKILESEAVSKVIVNDSKTSRRNTLEDDMPIKISEPKTVNDETPSDAKKESNEIISSSQQPSLPHPDSSLEDETPETVQVAADVHCDPENVEPVEVPEIPQSELPIVSNEDEKVVIDAIENEDIPINNSDEVPCKVEVSIPNDLNTHDISDLTLPQPEKNEVEQPPDFNKIRRLSLPVNDHYVIDEDELSPTILAGDKDETEEAESASRLPRRNPASVGKNGAEDHVIGIGSKKPRKATARRHRRGSIFSKTESEEREEMALHMGDVDTVIKDVRLGDTEPRSESVCDDSGASTRNEDSSVLPDSGIEPSPRHDQLSPSSSPRRVPRLCRRGRDQPTTPLSVTRAVQNTIRKYHLERKIFYQLLELKRLQIRAGRANEQILVKRLVDEYQRTGQAAGLQQYTDVYKFRPFEGFLYEQLHRLQGGGQMVIPQLKPTDDIETLSAILKRTRVELLDEIPSNPTLCTHGTHRCPHAAHAYTGIPCAAYITKLNHHAMPKMKNPGFLPRIESTIGSQSTTNRKSDRPVTLELINGQEKQVISLPTERLDRNKRYYVTFTIKGGPSPPPNSSPRRHQHAKSS